MDSEVWRELLRKIPANQHDNLRLVTSIGMEINVAGIVRVEPEYLVFRGREAASTDANRVFFVPFDQINYLGYKRMVKEAEVRIMFGEIVSTVDKEDLPASDACVEPRQDSPAVETPVAEEKIEEPAAVPEPLPEPEKEPAVPQMPGKAALLARLRNRVQTPANPPLAVK